MSANRILARAGSLLIMASGAVASLLPISLLAISARSYDLHDQALVAFSLVAATYVGQIVGAVTVEARLSSSKQTVFVPVAVTVLGLFGSVVTAFGSLDATVLSLGLFMLLPALIVGRTVSAAEARVKREAITGALIAVSLVCAFGLASTPSELWSVPIAAASLSAVLLRGARERSQIRVSVQTRVWVLADTVVTGGTQPIVTAILSVVVGPLATVQFRSVSSVVSAVEPAISFARSRLLRGAHLPDYVTSILVVGAISALLVALDEFNVLAAIMGSAWRGVELPLLLLALLGRICSLLSTPNFAALRRSSRVREVFAVRVVSTIVYTSTSILALFGYGVTGVFVAFLASELFNALLFFLVRKKLHIKLTD